MKNYEIQTLADLKSIEVVDPRVSDKYVPIYSSEIVKLMAPEFTFTDGLKFRNNSSAHYINLDSEDATLRIYNSYDRYMALRVSYVVDGLAVPLGIDKLVHLGQSAKSFTEDFADAKPEILAAVDTARVLINKMTTTDVTPGLAENIKKQIFTLPKARKLVSVNNPVDVLIDTGVTIFEYIKKSTNAYLKGDYQYTNEDGKTLKGPKNTNRLTRTRIENKLVKMFKEENPELFL